MLDKETVVYRICLFIFFVTVSLQAAQASTSLVGSTNGSFNVTPNGAATYDIPLRLPPGVSGMQPQLSLSYNSQSGNDIAGIGWSVTGFSQINRCPKTLAQDGVNDPVKMGSDDRFCWAGQRLVLTPTEMDTDDNNSGKSYGDPGTEYRTEIDSFARIVAKGARGNGPEWFEVHTKDGLIMEFGRTANARMSEDTQIPLPATPYIPNETVASWHLNRVKDTFDNCYDIEYYKDHGTVGQLEQPTGELLPKEVRYTCNVSGSLTANRSVQFFYENRLDFMVSRNNELTNSLTKRLERIETRIDSQLVTQYHLNYDENAANNASQLRSLQECASRDGNTTQCLDPIVFIWDFKEPTISTAATQSITALPADFKTGNILTDQKRTTQTFNGDFNGDGLGDLMVFVPRKGTLKTFLWDGNNFSTPTVDITDFYKDGSISPGDFNGDGITDIAVMATQGNFAIHTFDVSGNMSEVYSDTSGFNPGNIQTVEVNGDGISDLLYYDGLYTDYEFITVGKDPNTSNITLSRGYKTSSNNNKDYYPADFTGDGINDLAIIANNKFRFLHIVDGLLEQDSQEITIDLTREREFWKHIGYIECCSLDNEPTATKITIKNPIVFTDFNADGVTDFALVDYGPSMIDVLGDKSTWNFDQATLTTYIVGDDESATFTSIRKVSSVPLNITVKYKLGNNAIFGPVELAFPPNSVIQADLNANGQAEIIMLNDGASSLELISYETENGNILTPTVKNISETSYGVLSLSDFNADQYADYFIFNDGSRGGLANESSELHIYKSESGVPDRIKRIEHALHGRNGNDAFEEIEYGDYSKVEPRPMIPVYDGYAAGDQPERYAVQAGTPVTAHTASYGQGDRFRIEYQYEGLKIDRSKYGSLGFETLKAYDVENSTLTETQFSQIFPFTGMTVWTKKSLVQGTSFDTFTQLRDFFYITNHWEEWYKQKYFAEYGVENPGVLYFPYRFRTSEHKIDLDGGGGQVTTLTEVTYHPDGDVHTMDVETTGNGETFKTSTTNDYHPAVKTADKWFLGRLWQTEVIKTIPPVTTQPGEPPIASTSTRFSTFNYDLTGIGLKHDQTNTGVLISETIHADNADFQVTTEYGYDQWGHKTSAQKSTSDSPLDRTVSTVFATGITPDGLLTERVTSNDFNHSSRVKTDQRLGVPTVETDINNIVKTNEYDALGRQVNSTRLGITSTQNYLWCDNDVYCPETAVYSVTSQTTGGPWSTVYIDVLGRTVKTRTLGFENKVIVQERSYDRQGNLLTESVPYFEEEAGDVRYTVYTYDEYDRPFIVTAPDGVVTEYIYDGYTTTTTVIPPSTTHKRPQSHTRAINALGQMTKTIDAEDNITKFIYDADGNMAKMIDPELNVTRILFDERGFKKEVRDPDLGKWEYKYNNFGELKKQTDAKGQETILTYDQLGRLTDKYVEGFGPTSWYYDTATPQGLGKLHYREGPNGDRETLGYHQTHGLIEISTLRIDGVDYSSHYIYDNYLRTKSLQYPGTPVSPAGLKIEYQYDDNGFLLALQDVGDNHRDIWRLQEVNAQGQLRSEKYGNGVISTRTYDTQNNQLLSIVTGNGGSIQNLHYDWDGFGNLNWREDRRQIIENLVLREDFEYDDLNRITSSTVSGQARIDYEYDDIGNIVYRGDVGEYKYESERPHAVTKILPGRATSLGQTGVVADLFSSDINANYSANYLTWLRQASTLDTAYRYDENGNMRFGGGRAFKYTSFNKPSSITGRTHTVEFEYDGAQSRINKRVYLRPEVSDTPHSPLAALKLPTRLVSDTTYVGGLMEFIDQPLAGKREYRHNIIAQGHLVAVYTESEDYSNNANPSEWHYIHKDHLGSVNAVTDKDQVVIARHSYAPFGERRNDEGWLPLSASVTSEVTTRGFTQHEQLDEVALIHMNGRVYDPTIGRFLSADPFVQSPANSQALNRYSYLHNNPLNAVDPSGFFLKRLWRGVRTLGDQQWEVFRSYTGLKTTGRYVRDHKWAQTAVTIGAGFACAGVCSVVMAAGTSGLLTRLNGGTFRDSIRAGLVAGITAMAFHTVGEALPEVTAFHSAHFKKILAHSVIGGVSSTLQGGEFKQGFYSAGLAAFASPFLKSHLQSIGPQGRTVVAAVVGGTAAEIGGGKFANGAVTAAFSQWFNSERGGYEVPCGNCDDPYLPSDFGLFVAVNKFASAITSFFGGMFGVVTKNAVQKIALGKSIGLDEFAKSQSARTLMDDPDYLYTVFTELRAGTKFSVDLSGVGGKVDSAITRAATGRGSPFDLELLEIRNFLKEGGSPKQIDFFLNGKKVGNPF